MLRASSTGVRTRPPALEMPQIIPIFGQPHGHLAYDSGEFKNRLSAPRDAERKRDQPSRGISFLQPA